MKRAGVLLLLAFLACALCVTHAVPVRGEPHIAPQSTAVPFKDRAFYVRLQASQEGKADKLCGGVRLNHRWILTAAECLDNTQYTHVRITSLNKEAKLSHHDAALRKLDYLVHGKFDNATMSYNLALVKVDFEDWSDDFVHAELPSKSESNNTFVNQAGVVTGYNLPANPSTTKPLTVPSLMVKITEPSMCKGLFSPAEEPKDQVCTLPTVPGKELTRDDIGAPLTLSSSSGAVKLFGIVLHFKPAAQNKVSPIVFTRIAPHLDWLSRNTKIPVKN